MNEEHSQQRGAPTKGKNWYEEEDGPVNQCTTCLRCGAESETKPKEFYIARTYGMHKKLTEFIYWKRTLLKTNISERRGQQSEKYREMKERRKKCAQGKERIEYRIACRNTEANWGYGRVNATYICFVDINGERDPGVHQKAPYSIRLWCNPHNLIQKPKPTSTKMNDE